MKKLLFALAAVLALATVSVDAACGSCNRGCKAKTEKVKRGCTSCKKSKCNRCTRQ